MYGLVNKAIEDLVVSTAGEEVWQRVKARSNAEHEEFVEATNYDDVVTFKLVSAASEELGLPADEILYQFGRHWILYTGREGWESIFALSGHSVESFLMGLDDMHARVQVVMPESRMPQFSVTPKSDHLEVIYRSARDGLAPMVRGIMAGLAERFNENWQVTHTQQRQQYGYDTFQMKQIQSSSGDQVAQNAA